MTPTYREGDKYCSLWETADGWELRMADRIVTLGHLDVADAVAALHSAQSPIIAARYRWVA